MRNLWKSGDPWIWLTGGALATALFMIVGLLLLILWQALGVFWAADLLHVRLADGREALGQVRHREEIPRAPGSAGPPAYRLQLQVGNRDVYGADFRWIEEEKIASRALPVDAVVLERQEWGNLYGWVKEVRHDSAVVATGEAAWGSLLERLPGARRLADEIDHVEKGEMGRLHQQLDAARLELKRSGSAAAGAGLAAAEAGVRALEARYQEKQSRLESLRAAARADRVVVTVAGGESREIPMAQVIRAYRPNEMSAARKLQLYVARAWEFVSASPRESNTEGGVFPALFGTVMMVLIMSVLVVPFGVLAALYLREYSRQGVMVRVVRIAVNNLAGVPSIVFGVFGLGFFVYSLGGSIDALFFPDRLPAPTFGTGGILWASLTLALLTVPVVVVATEEALAAVPRENREGSLALGATKFETIWRVVLPNALPGILTGLILAMARGAGEVAPLMITGVVKLAPDMPFDASWPFLHLDRKFMHLGFHIFDVGFQSPNVEAAKPMVYATTLLLVGIIVTLNLAAILLRSRLRKRYATGAF